MKTCHVCGALVEDRELTCPECGATVVKHSGSMSLKQEETVKKKTNPMGMTISSGSGLTDILRSGNDDDSSVDDNFYGSMPTSLGREFVDTTVKKKSDTGKVFGTVVKILILAAVAYGIYYLVTTVFLKDDTIENYDMVLECYVDSINAEDVDKMERIMPPYVKDVNDEAKEIISTRALNTISSYDIVTIQQLDSTGIVALQDEIKMNSTKTSNIKDAYTAKIIFYGTANSTGGAIVESNVTMEMKFLQVRDSWYLYVE